MDKSYWVWLRWIPLTVALMSGIFSIYREAYSLYVGHIPAKSLFWECVWLSFVISAATAWVQEHRKYLAEVEKNSPRVSLRIHSISYAADPNTQDSCVVLFTVSVRNTGAPTIVDGWRLAVEDTSGLVIERLAIPAVLRWQYPNGLFAYQSEEAIYSKVGDVPVPTGGKKVGISLWKIRGTSMTEALENRRKLKFRLSARDVNDKEIVAADRAEDQEYVGRYYPGLEVSMSS